MNKWWRSLLVPRFFLRYENFISQRTLISGVSSCLIGTSSVHSCFFDCSSLLLRFCYSFSKHALQISNKAHFKRRGLLENFLRLQEKGSHLTSGCVVWLVEYCLFFFYYVENNNFKNQENIYNVILFLLKNMKIWGWQYTWFVLNTI